MNGLGEAAKALVANSRGIFAADAGPDTIGKRFKSMGMDVSDAETRRRYREVILTTPDLEKYIGGVILHDETIRQETRSGKLFSQALFEKGIAVGIKVDKGTKEMPMFPGEKVAEGLDGLEERLVEYKEMGAVFCKWRAVIGIVNGGVSRACLVANVQALARYAATAQKVGLVPVVEPEVLMEGVHSFDKCAEVTETLGRMTFDALLENRVDFSGILYKPNMVVAGKECSVQPGITDVAIKSVEVMKKVVSVGVPGVVFLSGGQDALVATRRLNEIARVGVGVPWRWSFSFERALEGPAMEAWNGKDENMELAQKVLVHRAKMNSLASTGTYSEEAEHEV